MATETDTGTAVADDLITPEMDAEIRSLLDDETSQEPTDTTTETPAGEEPSAGHEAAQPDAETQTDTGEGEDDAELAALAQAYGLPPERVQGMTKADFERSAMLFDSQLIAQTRARQQAEHEGAQAQQTQQQTDQQSRQPSLPQGAFELDWGEVGKDAYDEVVVKNLEALADRFNGLYASIAGRQAEDATLQFYEAFDSIAGELEPDLFGSDLTKLNEDQISNRTRLLDEFAVLQAGLQSLGHDASLSKSLVERAFKHAFADELHKRDRQRLSDDVQRQSRQRSPAGLRSSRDASTAPKGEPEADNTLKAAWREMQELAGVAQD